MDDKFRTYDFRNDPMSRGTPQNPGGCHGFILGPFCGQCINGNPIQEFTSKVCNTVGSQIQAAAFITTGTVLTEAQAQAIFQAQSNLACDVCD
jgi:hypothetical protein